MPEEEGKWSDRGMEEDESLKKTIECLRGRLVAERQQSKAAKESADQLSDKLKELENILEEEIKMRDRAEKKLRLLQTKMESMKVTGRLENSEPHSSSSVSENSLTSCDSSTTTAHTSRAIRQRQEQEPDSQIRDVAMSVKLDKPLDTAGLEQIDGRSFTGYDHNFSTKGIFCGACHENLGPELEVFIPDDDRHRNPSEQEENDDVDNSLALVAVNHVVAKESQTRELKTISRSVSEVLEALRLAREGIQRSM